MAQLCGAETCFSARQLGGPTIVSEGDCEVRYTPASTFKVAIALMGYDAGILQDRHIPRWPFQAGDADDFLMWRQAHDPALWFKNSCVWYSRRVTQQLGLSEFRSYIKQLQYGNQDAALDDALTHSWLSSSLAISPVEQIAFLEKLVEHQHPVSTTAHEMTQNIMFVEALNETWRLYGKTGSGMQQDSQGDIIPDRQVGWFIGFIQSATQTIVFAQLQVDEEAQLEYASIRAKQTAITRLKKLIEQAYDFKD